MVHEDEAPSIVPVPVEGSLPAQQTYVRPVLALEKTFVAELDRSATNSAGGCPSSRDANEGVPVKDAPRRDRQWGEGGTVRA